MVSSCPSVPWRKMWKLPPAKHTEYFWPFQVLSLWEMPLGNSLRSLPSAWIYVQWIYTHSCRQLTWEGEKQNQDLCFGNQEVQDSACQNQAISSVVVKKALVKQLRRESTEKWCSNNGTDLSGFAEQFNSVSSTELENNMPKWQIHFSTFFFWDVRLQANTALSRDQVLLVSNHRTGVWPWAVYTQTTKILFICHWDELNLHIIWLCLKMSRVCARFFLLAMQLLLCDLLAFYSKMVSIKLQWRWKPEEHAVCAAEAPH